MIYAILQLVIVLLVAGVLFWALKKLWPLTRSFGASTLGQVIYVLLCVVLALCIIFYGIVPVVEAIPGALTSHPFRS